MKKWWRDINYGLIGALAFVAYFWAAVAILIVRWS